MRTLILSTCIILLTSFCTKEANTANCGADYDYTYFSSIGMPGFQGNCYLVTNEQIRWLQLNGYIPNISTAPNNKTCPTKSQFEGYIGGFDLNGSNEYAALANNNCVPIGYWYPNL